MNAMSYHQPPDQVLVHGSSAISESYSMLNLKGVQSYPGLLLKLLAALHQTACFQSWARYKA